MEENTVKTNLNQLLDEADNEFFNPQEEKTKEPDLDEILNETDNAFFKSPTTQINKNFVSLHQFKDAITKGYTEYCYQLINNNQVNLTETDSTGFTALMTAIVVERFDIADKLIEKGTGKEQIKLVVQKVVKDLEKILPSSLIDEVLSRDSSLRKELVKEEPFLFHLIEFNKIKSSQYAIEKGLADKNTLRQDKRCFSALMSAILKNHFSIADYLITQDADIGYLKKWRYDSSDGLISFLFYLIDIPDPHSRKAIFYLLDQKLFDQNEKDAQGFSLLMAAITAHRFPLANGLIKRGMGKESIVFSKLLEKNNLEICQYVVENGLVDISEEHIRIAKKLKFTSIADYLVAQLKDKKNKQCTEINSFFNDLLKMKDSPISNVESLTAFNQLRIHLNNQQYTHYVTLTKSIENTLSGKKYIKLEPGKPLKTFILSLNELKESDFTQLKQTFEIKKQTAYQAQSVKIEEQPESFIEPRVEKTETYIKPHRETKKAPAENFNHPVKDKKGQKSPQPPKHKVINPNKKSHVTTKKIIKTTQPVETVNISRDLPRVSGISFADLNIVNKNSENIEKISYLPVFHKPLIAQKHKKLTFSYYHTETTSTIEVFTLPPEKGNHLSLLIHLCSRVKNQLINIEQNESFIFKQALLYDLFILLELIDKTFKLTNKPNKLINKSDELFPLREIKQLRQLIKEVFFNERKQNLNLNNLIRETEKICGRLQLIFDGLEQNNLTAIAIEPLSIEFENLKTAQPGVHSSFNLDFFKNYDPLTSIEYFNIIPYIDGFLNYVAIIENENEAPEKKIAALSAAKWCVIGLDKKQNIFESYMGKSTKLNDIFINIHTARNQLAHTESNEKIDVIKNLDKDERIVLDLKKFILQLQEKPAATEIPVDFTMKI